MNCLSIRKTAAVISRACSAFFAAIFLALNAFQLAKAEGFRIYGLSSEAQMRGEAVVASGSDASQVWYNPAGITKLGKLNVSANINTMILKSKFTNLNGQTEDSQRSFFPLPGLYASSNLGTEKFAVGLGVNTPFGLATEYSNTAPFRYTTTGGEIQLINVNPTVAYKILPTLSFGLGLDYYYSTAKLSSQVNWGATVPGSPDGTLTIDGKGNGIGFNTGFLYQPVPEHSLGITYRSQVFVKYTARNADLTNVPPALVALGAFPAGTGDVYATGARTGIVFPDIVGFGYAYTPSELWNFEFGGQWTNWQDVDTLRIDFDRQTAALTNIASKFDWYNSFVIRAGVTHKCSDALSLSGGYFFDKSPTNEANYSPLVSDGDHHVLSVGAKYTMGDWSISVPLVGIIQTGRDSITSTTANHNGKYSLYGIQTGLGVNYKF